MSPKVVKWSDVGGGADFSLPLLSDLVNKSFKIVSVRFDEGQYGEYAVVRLDDGSEYRTSSEVLLKQLHRIEEILSDPDVEAVEVYLAKVGRYYTFQ